MAKKRFNITVATLLSGCILYWVFFLINIATGIFASFFEYHITLTLSFSITTSFCFLYLILLCITSKDYIKQHPFMLMVFPADIIRLIVYISSWNWFSRTTQASIIGQKIVIIVVFIIWLVTLINFIYHIFKNNIRRKT